MKERYLKSPVSYDGCLTCVLIISRFRRLSHQIYHRLRILDNSLSNFMYTESHQLKDEFVQILKNKLTIFPDLTDIIQMWIDRPLIDYSYQIYGSCDFD